MARKKEPDKLAQEVSQALAAGMSYGKWKALQPVIPPPPKKQPVGLKTQVCAFCGCEFVNSDNIQRKYCGDVCRGRAYEKNRRGRLKDGAE